MVNLGSAVAYLDLDNSGFNSALTTSLRQLNAFTDSSMSIGDKFNALGGSLTSAGKSLTAGITTPILGLGAASVKMASDFEAAMSKVEAISGANAEEMELLTQKAKHMGETTKFSATESAEALQYMAMAGWKTEDMLNGIEGIMNLAAADGLDLATTSDIVTDALTAFGLTAKDSGHFADILAVAASNSNTNVAMLGESFKYAASTAGALNYSVEDIALALGLMANSGVKSSQAGTTLRASMSRLAKPTDVMVEKMQQLGLAVQNTSVEIDKGAIQKAEKDITKQTDKLKKAESQLANKTLDAEKAQIKLNDAITKYGENSSQAQKAAIDLEKAQNKVTDAVDKVAQQQDLLNQSNQSLLEAQKGVIEGTGVQTLLLTDASGKIRPFKEVLDILRDSFKDLSEAEQANAAATLFGQEAMSGMLAIINASDEDYEKLAAAISEADGTAEDMAEVMLDNLAGAVTILKSGIEGLAISFGEILIPKVRTGVEFLTNIVSKLNALDEETKESIVQIGLVVAAIGPLLLVLGSLFKLVGGGINTVSQLTAVLKGVGTAISGINAPVLAVVAVITALVGIITYLWNTNDEFKKGITDAWNAIKESVKNAIEILKPGLLDLKKAVGDLWVALQPLIELIGTVLVKALQLVAPLISVLATILAPVLTILADILTLVADIIALILSPLRGKNGMSEAVEQLKTDFFGMVDTIKGYYNQFTNWLVDTTEKAFNKAMEFLGIDYSFKGLIEDIKPGIQAVMTEFNRLKSKISEIASKVKEAFQSKAVEAFKKVLEKLSPLIQEFKNLMRELADDLTPFFDALKEAFEPFIENIGDALIVLADAMGILVALLSGDEQEISNAIGQFKNSMNTWKDGALEVFSILGEGIKLALQNVWETLKTWVIEKAQNIKENLIQTFENIKEQVILLFTEKIPQAFEDFMTYLATTPERIGEGIANAIITMDELKTKVDGLLEQLKEVISEKVKILKKELTDWFTDFPNKFDKVMNEARAFVVVKLINLKNDFREWWKELSEFFDTLPDLFKEKSSDMMTSFFEGFKTIGQQITEWFNTFTLSLLKGIGSVSSALSEVKNSDSSGSYSSGLDYVPYDGYVATLHEGERVLTKQENEENKDRISMVQNIYAPTSVNRETLREDTLELLRLAGVY